MFYKALFFKSYSHLDNKSKVFCKASETAPYCNYFTQNL